MIENNKTGRILVCAACASAIVLLFAPLFVFKGEAYNIVSFFKDMVKLITDSIKELGEAETTYDKAVDGIEIFLYALAVAMPVAVIIRAVVGIVETFRAGNDTYCPLKILRSLAVLQAVFVIFATWYEMTDGDLIAEMIIPCVGLILPFIITIACCVVLLLKAENRPSAIKTAVSAIAVIAMYFPLLALKTAEYRLYYRNDTILYVFLENIRTYITYLDWFGADAVEEYATGISWDIRLYGITVLLILFTYCINISFMAKEIYVNPKSDDLPPSAIRTGILGIVFSALTYVGLYIITKRPYAKTDSAYKPFPGVAVFILAAVGIILLILGIVFRKKVKKDDQVVDIF